MKSVSCTIWILAALLLAAVLDDIPDPPAVSPRAAACKVLHLRDYYCDTAIQRGDSLATAVPFPVSLVARDTCEPCRPSDCMTLTGQAADSSPPAPQAGRTLAFQS